MAHVGHLVCNQVRHSLKLRELRTKKEPAVRRSRSVVLERAVKDHLRDAFIWVIIGSCPSRRRGIVCPFLVDAIYGARARCLVGVVVEGQRAAVLYHIGFLALRLRRLWHCKQGDEQCCYRRCHAFEYISGSSDISSDRL